MKKNNYVQQLWADNPMPAVWKKFPLTMKLLFVFSFCFVGLLCASDSYAQRTIINVEAKNQTVKEVLSQIESQSEFSFFIMIVMLILTAGYQYQPGTITSLLY